MPREAFDTQQNRIQRLLLKFVRSNAILQAMPVTKIFGATISFRGDEKYHPGYQMIVFESQWWNAVVKHKYGPLENKWTCEFIGDHARFYSWLSLIHNFPAMRQGLAFDEEAMLSEIK